MLLVRNSNTNPYFNLALEEYLLTRFTENLFSLWINEAVIVVGKNQNTLAEINEDYVKEHGIRVVRRLTGGGAVFHDVGNVNFTYIEKNDGSRFNDYAHFTRDIVDYLKALGTEAELSGRNDLTIDGHKFSGNAQCMKNGRLLHHGTLLYSADLSHLAAALNASPLKIQSKGIKSVSSRVTNVIDHLATKLPVSEFKAGLENFMLQRYPDLVPYELSETDIANVNRLVKEKYSTWEWNFGASPNYNFHNAKKFPGGIVETDLHVTDGLIQNIRITGDFFGMLDIADIERTLTGVRHNRKEIKDALEKFPVEKYISGICAGELAALLA